MGHVSQPILTPLRAPTDDPQVRQAVADTYGTGHEAVQQYERVQSYAAMYPDKGSAAVPTAPELPRSRIRPCMNGGKPDAVRAFDTLADHG